MKNESFWAGFEKTAKKDTWKRYNDAFFDADSKAFPRFMMNHDNQRELSKAYAAEEAGWDKKMSKEQKASYVNRMLAAGGVGTLVGLGLGGLGGLRSAALGGVTGAMAGAGLGALGTMSQHAGIDRAKKNLKLSPKARSALYKEKAKALLDDDIDDAIGGLRGY